MIRRLIIALFAAGLFMNGCGEQRAPSAAPQPEAKPPAAPAPAAPVPAAPAIVAAPPEPLKPADPARPAAPAKPLHVADVIVLEASQGKVTLPHLVHARQFPCATCHGEATPGKMALDKESAHALCRDCHQARGAGPTACGGCHRK